jgi:O-antigen ligase
VSSAQSVVGGARDGVAQPPHAAARREPLPGVMLFRVLLALVLLAPLPLGAVYPLSWWIMACVAGLLLLAHAIGVIRGAIPMAEPVGRNWPWLAPFAAAAGWAALQASPLMPAAWHHPLWQRAATTLDSGLAGTISLDPFASVSILVRLLTYAAIFWLALQLGASRRRAKAAFLALSFAAVAYAVYGLFEKLSGANNVLWFAKSYYVTSVTSTFINRNNYAAFAGLGLICASGMIIQRLAEVLAAPARGRSRALHLLEVLDGWRGLLLPGWIVLFTALILTNSRGGVLSSVAGLIALLAAASSSRLMRPVHALAVAGVMMLGVVAFLAFSGEQVATRLAGTDLDIEARPIVYSLTAQEIAKSPWLGTGYGTFEDAFRLVRDERVKFEWDKAHNTYLENALELGVPAAALLTLSGVALFVRCLIGLRRRRHEIIYPAIGIGASVLIASHSVVDFSLQIPAISATYALIMGTAVVQSWSRRPLPTPS